MGVKLAHTVRPSKQAIARDKIGAVKLNYRHGSIVHVRMFDARTIRARVCFMEQTVAGLKVTVISGCVLNRVDAEQIVEVVKL